VASVNVGAVEIFADQPSTTISSGGTTAPAAGTSESWTVASSASFPAASSGASPPSQFHVVDALTAKQSEIVAVTNVSGTTWTVTRGAEGTTPVTHNTGFTVTQVTTSGLLNALLTTTNGQPWQFYPEAFGARGDGIIGTGGTGTSGTSAFSDAGASFTSADVGKVIIINQGTSGAGTTNGTTQNPFCGTISAVGSGTSVTLSGNLAAPCAAAPYIYGTDDQPAIQACLTAAGNWAAANGQDAEILLRSRAYMLGALTQQSSPKVNTHLAVPYGTQTGQRLGIRLRGLGAPQIEYWESTVPHLNGPCLVSAVFATGQPDATFGQVSILGGPSAQLGAGQFANVRLEIDGVSLVAPWNSQMYGADGRWIAQKIVPAGLFMAFVPVNVGGASIGGPYAQNIPSNGIAVGFAYPWASNNAANYGGMVSGESVPYAVAVSEHTTFTRLTGLYVTSACYITSAPSLPHALTIQHLCCEASANALDASGVSAATLPVYVAMIETEFMTNSIINDPNNVLTGFAGAAAGGASFVTVIGGQRLTVIDEQLHFPGPWSGAPAAPASGGASSNTQQNTSYRHASIYLSATTVTAVYTGPASTGLTSLGLTQASGGPGIMIRVPPGHYWSAAYTGTLTATWVLD
jgi:hypothetical protein